jgi:hypothetical protein
MKRRNKVLVSALSLVVLAVLALWRHGRQPLRGRCNQRPAALGPEVGGRDRRWSNYLHGQGFATGGRVAAGMTSILWPREQTTAKIVILGLGEPPQ